MSANQHIEIKKKLIECSKKFYADGPKPKSGGFVPHNLEADHLLWVDPFAFLVAVIADQTISAERAWEVPYLLKQRLGYLDPKEIAEKVGYEKMQEIFGQPPKLHKYYNDVAKAVVDAANVVVDRYSGDASKIWKDEDDPYMISLKLDAFKKIGQKKSSMATNILVRDFGHKVKSNKGIDISFDRHVRRVFLRSGLVDVDEEDKIISKARELNPDYPGEVEYPSWRIGRDYCAPKKPNCDACCLTAVCPKFTNLDISEPN